MKSVCAAGFKIDGNAKCSVCGAGPDGPCWRDYRQTMEENKRLREALDKIIGICLSRNTGDLAAGKVHTIAHNALSSADHKE